MQTILGVKEAFFRYISLKNIGFNDRCKYLGFPLKPNGHKIKGLGIASGENESRTNIWCNMWLLSGGRLNLVARIMLYSRGTLQKKLDTSLLVIMVREKTIWKNIIRKMEGVTKAKRWRCFRLKNVHFFTKSFAAKSSWRVIFEDSPWKDIIVRKYVIHRSIIDWIICQRKNIINLSTHCNALIQAFPINGRWLVWKMGNGEKVRVEVDPWIGYFRLLEILIEFVYELCIHALN